MKTQILENEYLQVKVLPNRGCKIISIRNTKNDAEWLWTSGKLPAELNGRESFDSEQSFGFDEMFPNIIPELYTDEGGKTIQLPDHGELWRLKWETLAAGPLMLHHTVQGKILPYHFSRKMILEEKKLRLLYRVENLKDVPIPALWTPHPLFSFFKETELQVPGDMKRIIQAMDRGLLGPYGTVHSLGSRGNAGESGPLFHPGELAEGSAFKFYSAEPLTEGWCGLRDRRGSLMLRFPAEIVPWLGFWINRGGWGEQYNAAPEPATAPMDSPGSSERMGIPAVWNPWEAKEWELTLEIG